MGTRARRSIVILVGATIGTLAMAAPASAAPTSGPGPGTMTIGTSLVLASSTGNKLIFTYTAAAAVSRGTWKFVVPTGWTPPQTKNSQDAGFVTASAGKLSIAKLTVSVRKLTLCGTCAATVTYDDATAPATPADLDLCHRGGGQGEKGRGRWLHRRPSP